MDGQSFCCGLIHNYFLRLKYSHQKAANPAKPPRRTDIIRNSAKYSVAEKQFEKDLKSGASVKTIYCDTNADGFPDVLLRKYRNPVVNKAVRSCPAPDPNAPLDINSGPFTVTFNLQFYANNRRTNPNYASNSVQVLVPASNQGESVTVTTGLTNFNQYLSVKDIYLQSGATNYKVPAIAMHARDLSDPVIPGWPYTSMLFMTVPLPFYNNKLDILHFPIATQDYYPLYGTLAEAEHRLTSCGKDPADVTAVNLVTPHGEHTTDISYPQLASPNEGIYYFPHGLDSATSSDDPKDFNKAWSPTGEPHPGFTAFDTGFYNPNDGNRYDSNGTLLTL